MSEIKVRNRKKQWIWFGAIVGIVMAVCVSLMSGNSTMQKTREADRSKSVLDGATPATRTGILREAMQVFEPSLEMKENVDFLLTPALLVQEAISEEIVVTYPSE
jgi:hypothetical protein